MTRRFLGRLVAAVVGVGVMVIVAFPDAASAHAALESSSPSASETLASPPTAITLNFSEPIESTFSEIQLFDSTEHAVRVGSLVRSSTDQSVISAEVPQLGDGVYVVVWRVVSIDGHPVNGAFPFTVGAPLIDDANDLVQRILEGGGDDPQLRVGLALARFMGYLGALVLIGHLFLTWKFIGHWSTRSIRLMKWATGLLVVGALGVLSMQGPFAAGRSWIGVFDAGLLGDVVSTRLGVATLIRLAFAIVWGMLILTAPRAAAGWWRAVACAASIATLVSFAASGHPSAGDDGVFHSGVDFLHLVAVCVWVGGVIALAWLVNDERVETLATRFSTHATWAMPLAIVTGATQALNLSGGIGDWFDSGYGRILIAKILLVLAAITMGAGGRRRLKRSGESGIHRMLKWEAALVVVVIALTAALVGTSPDQSGSKSGGPFSVTLVQGGVIADFRVEPARVGSVQVHAVLSPPGGTLEPVESVSVSLSLPGRDLPAIPVTMSGLGPNHFSGVVQIPYPGDWTFEARVVPEKNTTLLYSTTVGIAG